MIALALVWQGANLVLAARQQAALEAVARACMEAGGTAIAVPTDVTQPEACQQLINQGMAAFGQIDSLINNAETSRG